MACKGSESCRTTLMLMVKWQHIWQTEWEWNLLTWLPFPSSGEHEYCRPHFQPVSSQRKETMCVSDVYSFPLQTFQNVPLRSLTDLDAFTLFFKHCVSHSAVFFLHFLIKFTLTVIRISSCTVACCGDNFQKVLVKTSNQLGVFLYQGESSISAYLHCILV